jgi:hypothetical protein
MDEHLAAPTARPPSASDAVQAGTRRVAAARTPAPWPVADTMRRVHAALRDGAPPSYEALLAFGTPEPR